MMVAVGAGGDRGAATQRRDPQAIRARLADLERKREEALRERAIERARLVADVLKKTYGARQVILYGSLARGRASLRESNGTRLCWSK